MGRIFFLILLSSTSIVSLARPWIGVICAYFFVILTPQAVWYWNFQDIRPVYWVLLPTFMGFMFGLLKNEYNLSIVKNSRNLFLLILWLCFTLSYYIGPYVDDQGPYRFTDPSWAFSTINKIFLLYFLGCICINEKNKLIYLVYIFIISGVYLIYWANDQYLSGNFFGRLAGPVDVYGTGAYADENSFAMLFVVVLPFLWYIGLSFQKRIFRWGLWLVIPFGWHAIFLTGSRGGLIGVGASILLASLRSKKKIFGLFLIPAFIVAYQWQAGDVMKSRAGTISEYKTETSASTRLEAWEAAIKMTTAHPLTGVGLASFGPAFPDYSDKKPREAHNTFFQITAESGVIAGTVYIFIVFLSVLSLLKNGSQYKKHATLEHNILYLINEATLVAFCGLTICSLFLSLQMFEIFYCLCLLVNSLVFITRQTCVEFTKLKPSLNVL